MAYSCNAVLALLRFIFENNPERQQLDAFCTYISTLASLTYLGLANSVFIARVDMKSVLFAPMRWALYCFTMPAIWWVIAHISSYSFKRKLYVLWLNWVMLIAGGLATVPQLPWAHKVFWMALSCVPFPELCFHLWQMVTDALVVPVSDGTHQPGALSFIRVYGQLSYQFFPAIYFAAFDGCLPLAVSEPLWSLCDWGLKMVATSSLMDANFVTIEQRQQSALRYMETRQRMDDIRQLAVMVNRKDDFLAAISHELCTPLNGIIGLSDALLSDASLGLPSTLVKTMTVIKISGKRLLQLIYDILDSAVMRHEGRILIKHQEVDLKPLIADVVDVSGALLGKAVKLRVNLAYMPKIVADTGRVVQVLYNLIGNACKFTLKGEIVVSSMFDEARQVVGVRVSDTGCGIQPENIHRIFEAYDQGDSSTARQFGGTGLGLHLANEIMKAHNGSIDVASVVGEGSVFTVWFPVAQPVRRTTFSLDGNPEPASSLDRRSGEDRWALQSQATVSRSPRSPPPMEAVSELGSAPQTFTLAGVCRPSVESLSEAGGESADEGAAASGSHEEGWWPAPLYASEHGGKPLVIFADTTPLKDVVQDTLAAGGFTLLNLQTGARVLDRLQASQPGPPPGGLPDAILAGSVLPDMDGLSLARSIRQLFPHSAIPVFMLSSNFTIEQMQAGLEVGCTDYLRRPLSAPELLCRLRFILSMREPLLERLGLGPRCIRSNQLKALPLYHRSQIAAGCEVSRRLYRQVSVLHLSLNWEALAGSLAANAGPMARLYLLFVDAATRHGFVRIQTASHGYACMCCDISDDEAAQVPSEESSTPPSRSVYKLAAELIDSISQLRNAEGVAFRPSVGVAVGAVDTCLSDASDPCTMFAFGPCVDTACALADVAPPDSIACMAYTHTAETRSVDVPFGLGCLKVAANILSKEQALEAPDTVWNIGRDAGQSLAHLRYALQDLKATLELVSLSSPAASLHSSRRSSARGSVHSNQSNALLHPTAGSSEVFSAQDSRRSAAIPAIHPTVVRSHMDSIQLEPFPAQALAHKEPIPARASSGALPVPVPAAEPEAVLAAATAHARAAELDDAVCAALPSLAALECASSVESKAILAQHSVSVLQLAFMTTEGIAAFGLPVGDALRLLAAAKRALTAALQARS